MIEFKEIIHFYQGCEMMVYNSDGTSFKDILNIVSKYDDDDFFRVEVWGNDCECVLLEDVKLILRDIETMTDDEKKKYSSLCFADGSMPTAESFAYLINSRFDIFYLKNKGHAIYEETTKEILKEIKVKQQERESKPYEFGKK